MKEYQRSDGERVRAREQIARMETMLESISHVLHDQWPPGIDQAQAIVDAAALLAMTIAKLDAYLRAEGDSNGRP